MRPEQRTAGGVPQQGGRPHWEIAASIDRAARARAESATNNSVWLESA